MEMIWLQDFLMLAEHLNFSRAAAARNVTQPAFSRRIRALEEWVGAPLCERSTHHVSLTPAGEHFRREAAILVGGLHRLRRDVRDIAGRRPQGLSLAATHALSFSFFPAWIRRNPSMLSLGTISLISDSMQACERLMQNGDAQLLLCHQHSDVPSRLAHNTFASVTVGQDMLVPLSAPDKAGAPLWSLDRDGPLKYLAYSEQSGLGRILFANRDVQQRLAAAEKLVSSHLAATLQTMALAGEGVAWLPQTLAHEDITEGRLVFAAHDKYQIPLAIKLIRPRARLASSLEEFWESVIRTERFE